MLSSKLSFYAYKYVSMDRKYNSKAPSIKVNIQGYESQITFLFGMDSKYLFRNFNRNNIQLTNTWYFDNIYENVITLSEYIFQYNPSTINMIGTSKSCNGAIILSSKLSEIFPNITFRLFLFSPYTIFEQAYFRKFGLMDKLPPTLIDIMCNSKYKNKLKKYGDSRRLLDKKNIYPFIIYPKYSLGGESLMASRLYELRNATFLPLPLITHSLIHPFWKKIESNMEIEIFESTKKKLPLSDFKWFDKIQNDSSYAFDIYNLVFDTNSFVDKILKVTIP